MKDVTIIIPQRGNEHLTRRIVNQIRKYEDVYIFVVDDKAKNIEDRDPTMHITAPVLMNGQRGLTAAWNCGIQIADTQTVILLNNDVKCRKPFIDLAMPPNDKTIIGAEKRRERLFGLRKLLQGWFMAFHKSLWERLGGFDERFKLYYADTDFQVRALQDGCKLKCVKLPLLHLEHKTAHNKKLCPDRGVLLRRDGAAYLKKHGGRI